jgi:creatinine amidohydrolase
MSEFRLAYLRRPEVLDAKYEVAVLPIGSTEPHAQHLVYGTDTLQVERFAERVVAEANQRGARCLLLPTMPYSCNANLHQCTWALALDPRTLVGFVADVVATAVRQGIRKIVILNGHGGNGAVLQAALRELHPKFDAFIAISEWFGVAGDVESEVMETKERGHACEMETSSMLYLAPEGVDMSAAEPTRIRKTPFSNRALHFVSRWHALTVNTGIGDPTKATAEKGRRILEAAIDRVATALKELSDEPYGDLFPYRD